MRVVTVLVLTRRAVSARGHKNNTNGGACWRLCSLGRELGRSQVTFLRRIRSRPFSSFPSRGQFARAVKSLQVLPGSEANFDRVLISRGSRDEEAEGDSDQLKTQDGTSVHSHHARGTELRI